MLVVIALLMVLAASLLPRLGRARQMINPIRCTDNLKEIYAGYRLWADDIGDLVPAQQSISSGGWKDLLTNADQGAICWTNYVLMANEMGASPKTVVCPKDERASATNFTTDFKDNAHVSYFVGVSASDTFPQSILGGDRNLGNGPVAHWDYGFSPASGEGNDVAIPISGPVSWSLKMHSAGKTAGAGNILLSDGSVQQVSSASLNKNWLPNAVPTTNWPVGHVPATPSIRLVFP